MMAQEGLEIGGLSVSRETFGALEEYAALVRRWNPAINLVSKSSLAGLEARHIADSAQLFELAPRTARRWVDLGSGGGFPGVVVAILARERNPDLRVTLVEADARKATFLRQAAQALGLEVAIVNGRIESIPALSGDVVSARALASLTDLLAFAERHIAPGGCAVFPKGARFATELAEARKTWDFEVESHPSLSEPGSAVLVIREIRRAKQN